MATLHKTKQIDMRDLEIILEALEINGTDLQDIVTLINAIPTADQNDSETIWNDGGVLKVSSAP